MRFFVPAALAALTLTAGCRQRAYNNDSTALIKGGEPAKPGEYPTTVGIVNKKSALFCSGTLLTAELVLTAGHCLAGREAKDVRVHVGNGVLGGKVTEGLHDAAAMQVHPGYGSFQDDKEPLLDVAWIKLKAPVPGIKPEEFVQPLLDLRELGETLQPESPARLAGFGCQDQQLECTYGTKRWADVTFLKIDPLIAGVVAKTGIALQGDSGGPAFVQLKSGAWRVLGATSTKLDSYSAREDAAYAILYPSVCWLQESSGVTLPGADVHCAKQDPSPSPTAEGLKAACEKHGGAKVRASIDVLKARLGAGSCAELVAKAGSATTLDLSGVHTIDGGVLGAMTALKELDLGGMQVVPEGAVGALPKLEKLTVSPYYLRKGQLAGWRKANAKLRLAAARPVFEAFNAISTGADDAFGVALDGVTDVETVNEKKETVLLAAVWAKREEMVRLLIARKANVNAANPDRQNSPLHYAVIVDNPGIVRLLVAAGASKTAKNASGETPLEMAVRFNQRDVVAALAE